MGENDTQNNYKSRGDFFLGVGTIIILALVIFAFNHGGGGDDDIIDEIIYDELEIELYSTGGSMFTLTNRNNFDWHNVKIILDDYNECSRIKLILSTDESFIFYKHECGTRYVIGSSLQKITIVTDEGTGSFTYG